MKYLVNLSMWLKNDKNFWICRIVLALAGLVFGIYVSYIVSGFRHISVCFCIFLVIVLTWIRIRIIEADRIADIMEKKVGEL